MHSEDINRVLLDAAIVDDTLKFIKNRDLEKIARIESGGLVILLAATPSMAKWSKPGVTPRFLACCAAFFDSSTLLAEVRADGFYSGDKKLKVKNSDALLKLCIIKIRELVGEDKRD